CCCATAPRAALSPLSLHDALPILLDRPRAWAALRGLTLAIAATTSMLLLVTATTPLGSLWLGRVSALPPPLVTLGAGALWLGILDRKSTRLNSSHVSISYAVFCLK